MRYLAFLSCITFLLLIGASASPAPKVYTLQDALDKKLIEVTEVLSKDGGTKVKLAINNLHKKQDLKIQIPSGVQFASRDTSEQDIIIIEEKFLFVKAKSAASLLLNGYCTQATNRSPSKGSTFSLKPNADGILLKLSEYLYQNKEVDEYLYQHAIWVVTNDHDLKGLHHDDPEKSIAMHKFISDLTGKQMPKYTVRYDDGREGEVAFTGIIVMIYGNFEYDLDKDCAMTCEIYNESGEMVQSVFKDMMQKQGHSKFQFKLKARDLPKGKYTSKLFKSGEIFMEMEVEV